MTVAAEMPPVGETAAADQKIKVAVRVRPLNKRELELRTKIVVKMDGNQTILEHPVDENKPKPFAFDYSFDSSDQNGSQFASQEKVFNEIGYDLMENSFAGYNACLFAYGQTSSGKSYSMMGTSDQPGIIPRLCNEIFKRIDQTTSDSLSYKVEVSYMEIYNERVRDLLDPKKSNKTLKVREHKILGPIVDGLSNLAVDSYQQIESLIGEGNKSRTVAATNMNAESSRSHAVFNITLTQTLRDIENGFSGEKVSKISLVDLAGSERVAKTGAMGKRLEEGGSINKSLTTLGMVISALAERSNSTKKDKFIPYRDSVLTWLLRDNLGGNSRTVMIATVSPAADNYEETLSTLRYADRAKKIVNHAVVNEDPNARIIRELREEVESLRMQISQTKKEQTETLELRERLAESERLVAQMNKSWEERLRETETLNKERQRDLSEIGISVESSGIKVEKDKFYLVNLNADPSLNELLVYYVNGTAIVGNTEEIDASRDSGLGSSVEELHLKASPNGDSEKTNIVLRGLGVVHRHAKLSVVSEDGGKTKRLYIEPLTQEGRVFVNGRQIGERTLLRNGYRLLFGVHHFFKVNCPKEAATDGNAMEESCMYDYKDAWDEVNGEGAGGISAAVDQLMQRVSIKHEEDKKAALEQQYEAFEQYIQNLQAGGFTPSTPMTPCWNLPTPLSTPASALPPPFPFAGGSSGGGSSRQTVKSRFFYWAQKKKEMLAESLKRLKADLIRAHAMTNEANMISKELAVSDKRVTTYDVTLHIPAANLRPSKIKAGAFICEPVIVVRRVGMSGAQLWSMSQLENKLIDMRELYDDRMNEAAEKGMTRGCGSVADRSEQEADEESPSVVIDPFFESQEQHSLIGVANVFLEVLLHDLRLDYQVPIISQQGEVAGRLHVQIYRVAGPIESEDDRAVGCENLIGKVINCRVRIKRVCDLPESLSHFVFCQYSFFNATEMLVVAPSHDLSHPQPSNHTVVIFEHQRDFPVVVTEEFLEYVQEDALSIEVWGHRSCGSEQKDAAKKLDAEERNKSLQARWGEVSRRLELWMQINELNENGKWEPVECRQFEDVSTGGVYQLRQGQQRRICVGVNLPFSEGLPLHIDSIHSVAIGCIWPRKPNVHKTLDSYQEEDLEVIRSQWTGALQTRQKYLEQQLDKLSSRSAKSESDKEREHSLMAQWIALTEERAAVAIPAPNSKIPGSPCDWTPPLGTEKHVPVVFLDLNPDDMAGEASASEVTLRTAGQHSILPLETNGQFIMLPPLQFDEKRCCVLCPWDSSVHDNDSLNVVTPSNERIYAILKATVRLSHPCVMDVVLRKRICMQVYKKSSFAERIFKRMIGTETAYHTSVLYDLVAHVPKSSCDIEERESLAMLAAKHAMGSENEVEAENGRTEGQANGQTTAANPQLSYIEAYTNSIQAVESMLKLDRLRQEVAITNMLSRKERQERLQHFGLPPHSLKMKRTVSLPNAISNSTTPLPSSSNCGYDSPMGTSTTTSMTPSCRPPRPTFLSLAHSTSNSSRLTSLVSPANERLSGIDEESKEAYPVRSSTVPDALSKNTKDLSNEQMDLRNGNLLLSSSSSKISPLGDCTSSASGCAGSGALGAMRWANKPPQGLDLNV